MIAITTALAAFAQDANAIFTCKIGDAEVSLLSEGQQRGNPSTLIGATPEMLATYAPDGDFPTAVNAFLIRLPERTILVDAGFGTRLFDNLQQLNVRPEEIDVLLLTHLHGDHIRGMIRNGAVAFPRAEVYLSKAEHDYWTSDEETNRLPAPNREAFITAQNTIRAYKKALHLFTPNDDGNDDNALLPGIYPIAAYGHTPGHTIYLLKSGNDRLLLWGDLTHATALQMPCPEIAVTYDVNPEEAIQTRQRTLAYVAEQHIPVAGMHIAYPGVGRIFRNGAGYFFEPSIDNDAFTRAVDRQLQRYPESRLTDIYKHFFQDYFGPGHAIKDPESAGRYLQQELALCGECTGDPIEPTGWQGRYCRVDLCVVKENRITQEALLNAFIESANNALTPPPEAWSHTWNEMIRRLDAMPLDVPDYETDKAALQAILHDGHYAVHHSETYEQHYNPHYRIIRKTILDRLTENGNR
ncbi:MAG: MBL fold metallo-hydrolase [Prevotellaceae bacterium]|nr:MBL fold metallo-hydrolase [Prevotellaceae bacterium]